MRGIAILAIVLHNYCHFAHKIVQENEYQYLQLNNDRLWQELTHPDTLLPVHLLSYFGHYGVPVFLFLSGLGLVMKYERSQEIRSQELRSQEIRSQEPGAWRFLRYHYLKLLRMLFVGFSIFVMVDVLTPGRFPFHWDNIVAQLLMYINVLPRPDKIIWPGIYWFFGLMLQLYIVYRLFLYRQRSLYVVLLIAVCWLLQALCQPDGETLNRLRYNFIGGMLPFSMGILAARSWWKVEGRRWKVEGGRWKEYSILLFPLSIALVSTMCLSFQSWLWIPAVIVVGTIALVKILPEAVLRVFVWFGSISAAMFVAHPIARKLMIIVAWKQDVYDGLMLYLIVTIALSWAVKQILDRIPMPRL